MAEPTTDAACSQELLPILAHALPTVISYTLPSERVVQANAEGARILARHSSTLSAGDGEAAAGEDEGADGHHGSTEYLVDAHSDIEETELFLKRVAASSYAHKSWTDMRRTLVYLRTEVRFYNEIVPLLLSPNGGEVALQSHLPVVHHSQYDLEGLVPEDSPSTDATQPSPFPEGEGVDETQKQQLLEGRGGHILLQSLSPSHGYFQDSPILPEQAMQCLKAVAELHASAWANKPLLQKFRNPKELQNMVASWEGFRERFRGVDGAEILEKESVAQLGQRIYDMAGYVSKELSPSVDDEYATLVHGDYKAMNVFLPNEANGGGEGDAIMIDFSCVGIGYGMSDVGMHIVHAVRPSHLENGGEERLVEGYLASLEEAMNRRPSAGEEKWSYPRDVAMRHYRLACVDYIRFIMGRFWRSATPESFESKKKSKNTTLINRDLDAAMAFIRKVDTYLEMFEREKEEIESQPESRSFHER